MAIIPPDDEYVHFSKDGRVEFTVAGINKYRSLMGRAGIDIRTVKDYSQYMHAMRAIRPYEHDDLRSKRKTNSAQATLEYGLLDAILEGNDILEQQLTEQLDRRKKSGLSVIQGQKKED